MISIQVRSAKLVTKALQDLRAEIPRISKDHLSKLGRRVVRQMQNYPPQRSGSNYVRTFRFKNSWIIKEHSKGVTINNTATNRGRSYSNYVVGDAQGKEQAWMHVGTWLLFRDVVDYEMTKLPNAVENSIRLFARGRGL